jgi:probable phosphoglycerate mutase
MSTRVFLVRHGATQLSQEDSFAGATDVQLSDLGRAQVRSLAQRLAREKIDAVYASPMSRTMETARILAEPHGLEVTPRPDLREMNHGHWEGLPRSKVEASFPEEYAAWEADPYTSAPEGGESGLAVTARALPALLSIVGDHHKGGDQTVLVVSHKATIRLLLSALLGFDPRTYRDRLDQSPASLNALDFKGPTRARLTLFNDTAHFSSADSSITEKPHGRLSKWWS